MRSDASLTTSGASRIRAVGGIHCRPGGYPAGHGERESVGVRRLGQPGKRSWGLSVWEEAGENTDSQPDVRTKSSEGVVGGQGERIGVGCSGKVDGGELSADGRTKANPRDNASPFVPVRSPSGGAGAEILCPAILKRAKGRPVLATRLRRGINARRKTRYTP